MICVNIWNERTVFHRRNKDQVNPFSTNFTKWSNTLKQFVGNLPTNCLRLFYHFVWLVLKGLINLIKRSCNIIFLQNNGKPKQSKMMQPCDRMIHYNFNYDSIPAIQYSLNMVVWIFVPQNNKQMVHFYIECDNCCNHLQNQFQSVLFITYI